MELLSRVEQVGGAVPGIARTEGFETQSHTTRS